MFATHPRKWDPWEWRFVAHVITLSLSFFLRLLIRREMRFGQLAHLIVVQLIVGAADMYLHPCPGHLSHCLTMFHIA